MQGKELPYKRTILYVFLLWCLVAGALLMISDYIGLYIGKVDEDRTSVFELCLAFISLLLVLRILQPIYFKKIIGDWTQAGNTRWRYCLICSLFVALVSSLIDHFHFSQSLTILLEFTIAFVIAMYFVGKYLTKYPKKYTEPVVPIKNFTERNISTNGDSDDQSS